MEARVQFIGENARAVHLEIAIYPSILKKNLSVNLLAKNLCQSWKFPIMLQYSIQYCINRKKYINFQQLRNTWKLLELTGNLSLNVHLVRRYLERLIRMTKCTSASMKVWEVLAKLISVYILCWYFWRKQTINNKYKKKEWQKPHSDKVLDNSLLKLETLQIIFR